MLINKGNSTYKPFINRYLLELIIAYFYNQKYFAV